MSRTSFLLRTFLALGALGAGTATLQAAPLCAKTGTQLYTFLDTAAHNGVDDEIRIPSGTLTGSGAGDLTAQWPYVPVASDSDLVLDVSGGWDATCTSQTGVPEDTQIDAQFKGSAFLFRSDFGLGGKITLRNLTITRAKGAYLDGAAVAYDGQVAGGGFTMERVAIINNDAINLSHSIVYVNQGAGGQVKLLDNDLSQNQALVSGSSMLRMSCVSIALCSCNNNSIHDNYALDDVQPFGLYLLGTVYAANNAVADNLAGTVYGGHQAGTGGMRTMTLRNNHFASSNFNNEYLEQGTTKGPAKWTQVGLHRVPNPDSPLRNSGYANPLGGVGSKDIVGKTRVQDGVVDRGAFEAEPVPNSAPTLNVASQYTVVSNYPVGWSPFGLTASDDGQPKALAYSFTYSSCPGLFAINATSGAVRLMAPVPAGLAGCNLEVQAFDGQYADVAQTVVLFGPPQPGMDGIFRDGFD